MKAKFLMFLFGIFCLSMLFSGIIEAATTISSCENGLELNTENEVYTLDQDITSNYTCLNVTANNVTIDGAGYTLNYSANGSLGYGVYSSYNGTTIKNLIIKEGTATTASKYAIFLNKARNATVYNNSADTYGSNSHIVYYTTGLIEANISNNLFNSSSAYSVYSTCALAAGGISLCYNNSFNNNYISAGGAGFYLVHTNTSKILNNLIIWYGATNWGVSGSNSAHYAEIINNTFYSRGSASSAISSLGTYVTVYNNFMNGTAGGGISAGDRWNVTGNIITTTTGAPITPEDYGYYEGNNITSTTGLITFSADNHNIFKGNNHTITGNGRGFFFSSSTRNNTFFNQNMITKAASPYQVAYVGYNQNFSFFNSILNSTSSTGEIWIELSKGGDWNFTNVTNLIGDPIRFNWLTGSNGTINYHWNLDTCARYTNGQPVVGYYVNVTNKDGLLVASDITGSDGCIPTKAVLEYIRNNTNGSTTWYYSNYTINVTNLAGVQAATDSVNMTTSQYLTLELDADITITNPSNNSYLNFVPPYLNYSIAPYYNDSCWYTLDGGSNVSVNCTEGNYTLAGAGLTNGTYDLRLWANESSGIYNWTDVRFTIDTNLPSATLISPENDSFTNASEVNFTVFLNESYVLEGEPNYSLCYQETANVSTACGGLNTGTYYTEPYYLYINYTKPSIAGAIWQTRLGYLGIVNLTLPAECISASIVELRTRQTATTAVYAECLNKTSGSWVTLQTSSGKSFGGSGSGDERLMYDGNWNTGAAYWSAFSAWMDTVNDNKANTGVWEEAIIWNISTTVYEPVNYSGIQNATLYVYNYSGLVNQTTQTFAEGIFESLLGIPVTLIDGVYSWFYNVFDWAGNEYSTENYTLTVDTSAPGIEISFPVSGTNYTTIASVPEFNYSITDTYDDSCWYTLNGGASTTINCSLVNKSITVAEGSNTIALYANDSAGNQNSSTVTFLVDSLYPNIEFTSPTETDGSSLARSYFLINVTANDTNLKNISIRVYNSAHTLLYTSNNNTSPTTASMYWNVSGLADGLYYFNATAYDTSGNVNYTLTRNVTLDTTYPLIDIIYPLNQSYNTLYSNVSAINYTLVDINPDACWYSLNGGASVTFTCGENLTNLVPQLGSNTWSLYANDSAGNINSTSITFFINPFPNVTFNYQQPADLATLNALVADLNISYNLTDYWSPLNTSTIKLYYKVNSSLNNYQYYQNGTPVAGYFGTNNHINTSETFLWSLQDNSYLPGTYNLGEITMENNPHQFVTLGNANQFHKIQLYNVSNDTSYGFYEVMANATVGSAPLKVYYCNESYSTGKISANANCYQFGTLTATQTFHHIHTNNSAHQAFSFAVNGTDGTIGTVKVTSTSYFVVGGAAGWHIYYVTNSSRANAIQTTANEGNAWSSQTYTVDSHLHQFEGNTTFWYYSCANNTYGNENCSEVRYDIMQLSGIPPTSPLVYSPAGTVYKENININYTASVSPNAYPIAFYNISLLNASYSFLSTIRTNNSQNLSYVWDSTTVANGEYIIMVNATDNMSVSAYGFSANFTVDNLAPTIDFVSPTPVNYTNLSTGTFAINVSSIDLYPKNVSIDIYNQAFTRVDGGTWTDNAAESYYHSSTLADGRYYYNATSCDMAGNCNYTETRSILIDTTLPLIEFTTPTVMNNSNLSRTNITANITFQELNPSNITFALRNSTSIVNVTTFTNNQTMIVWYLTEDGVYYYNVTIVDVANNRNVTTDYKITLDNVNPNGTIDNPINGTYYNNSFINFTLDLSDNTNGSGLNNASIYIYNQSGEFVDTNTTSIIPGTFTTIIGFTNYLLDGIYDWFFQVYDYAGNYFQSSNETIHVDTTVPVVTYLIPNNIITANVSLNLSSTVTDNIGIANITFRLNNLTAELNNTVFEFTPYQTSIDFSQVISFVGVTEAVYNWSFEATDWAGNKNIIENYTIYLNKFPEPVVTFPQNNYYYNSSSGVTNITFDVGDPNPYNCWYELIVGAVRTNNSISCISPAVVSINNEGNNTILLYVNDTVGQTNGTLPITFVLDRVQPYPEWVAPTYSSSIYDSIVANISDSETIPANVTFQLEGPSASTQVIPVTAVGGYVAYNFSGLSEGYYNLSGYAVDKAGNRRNIIDTSIFPPAERNKTNILLDLNAPVMAYVSPTPAAGSTVYVNYIDINVTATDYSLSSITLYVSNGSGHLLSTLNPAVNPTGQYKEYQAYFHYNSLTNGNYTINATAIDTFGRTTNLASRTIRVDFGPNVSTCRELSVDGNTYYLSGDITDNTIAAGGACFNITGNNIKLDCNGYSITSTSAASAVLVSGSNVEVTGCTMDMGAGAGGFGMRVIDYGSANLLRSTIQNTWAGISTNNYGRFNTGDVANYINMNNLDVGIYLHETNYSRFRNIAMTNVDYMLFAYDKDHYNKFSNVSGDYNTNAIYITNGDNNYFQDSGYAGAGDSIYLNNALNTTFLSVYYNGTEDTTNSNLTREWRVVTQCYDSANNPVSCTITYGGSSGGGSTSGTSVQLILKEYTNDDNVVTTVDPYSINASIAGESEARDVVVDMDKTETFNFISEIGSTLTSRGAMYALLGMFLLSGLSVSVYFFYNKIVYSDTLGEYWKWVVVAIMWTIMFVALFVAISYYVMNSGVFPSIGAGGRPSAGI